jgi:hypothetical protein
MRTLANLAAIVLVALISGCDDGHLRGSIEQSEDGKTYFAVTDDNGGFCGYVKLDGTEWTHAVGELAEIEPGPHMLECGPGGKYAFDVPPGVVFRFDYWGP